MDGQPLFVNPAFCSFLGFTEQELHSKHCVDFSPPEDAAKDWVLFQQLRAGSIDHYQLEKRYFRKDGSLVWGSLSISLLKSHPSPLVIAMVEDITARKAAEEGRFRTPLSSNRLRMRSFPRIWRRASRPGTRVRNGFSGTRRRKLSDSRLPSSSHRTYRMKRTKFSRGLRQGAGLSITKPSALRKQARRLMFLSQSAL
jgi:PAS domain S-box-containing protein